MGKSPLLSLLWPQPTRYTRVMRTRGCALPSPSVCAPRSALAVLFPSAMRTLDESAPPSSLSSRLVPGECSLHLACAQADPPPRIPSPYTLSPMTVSPVSLRISASPVAPRYMLPAARSWTYMRPLAAPQRAVHLLPNAARLTISVSRCTYLARLPTDRLESSCTRQLLAARIGTSVASPHIDALTVSIPLPVCTYLSRLLTDQRETYCIR